MTTMEFVRKCFENKLEPNLSEPAGSFNALDDIVSLIDTEGLINIEREDVQKIADLSSKMVAVTAEANGAHKIEQLGKMILSAIPSAFREGKATSVLFNVTGGPEMRLDEVKDVAEYVYSSASDDASIIFGAVIDEKQKDAIRVTAILGKN